MQAGVQEYFQINCHTRVSWSMTDTVDTVDSVDTVDTVEWAEGNEGDKGAT